MTGPSITAHALVDMKKAGVIHRDLKPENILLCNKQPTIATPEPWDYIVKLTDFGWAYITDVYGTGTTYCGTEPYMAPEVIRRNPVYMRNSAPWWRDLVPGKGLNQGYDFKCDIFSVGVILYECATGCLLFKVASKNDSF